MKQTPSVSVSPWRWWCWCWWRCWCRGSNLLRGRFGHEDKVWDLESGCPQHVDNGPRLKWNPNENDMKVWFRWIFRSHFGMILLRFQPFLVFRFHHTILQNGKILPQRFTGGWGACIWIREVHVTSLLYKLRGHFYAGWEIIDRKFQLPKLIYYFCWNFERWYTVYNIQEETKQIEKRNHCEFGEVPSLRLKKILISSSKNAPQFMFNKKTDQMLPKEA